MDKIAKNDIFTAEIEGWSSEGEGIARHEGMAVFAHGAVRGDLCELRLTKVLKNRAYARVERVLRASAHRAISNCPAFPRCGGCDFRHITYEEELRLKAERVRETLRRIGGIDLGPVEIRPSPLLDGSRNKAQFPVGTGEGGVELGFYRRRSHDIVAIDRCPACDERASALARAVRQWANETGARAYDERTGAGFLRHIHARVARGGTHLCLVTSSGKIKNPACLIELAQRADQTLAGVSHSVNAERTNRIMGGAPELLWGALTLDEDVCGNTFRLSPHSFFQVNKPVADALYAQLLDWAGAGAHAVDLYCGTGTITLALARAFERVIGVEISAEAVGDAIASAARNGVSNVEYLCMDAPLAALRLAREGAKPGLVVCDPPRKGMGADGVQAVCAIRPARIIYVACDPAALARDAAALIENGYAPSRALAFDMFPRTANVETLMLLERACL